MRYSRIPNTLFINNRKRLKERILPNSAVIMASNDILPTNADGTLPFKQNSHLFYLTGVDQEETFFVFAPDHPDEKLREILFLRETNDQIAVWEGAKLTKEQGKEVSGIKEIKWNQEFESLLPLIFADVEHVYLYKNEHARNASIVETANDRLVNKCVKQFPLHDFKRFAPVIYELRASKSQEEIDMLQKACDITEKGFRRVLKAIKAGVKEYELEAEYVHEFVRHGSKGFAYTPIIASGANSNVLHYIENSGVLKDGDLLLMDVGAEYGNYNADLTRTVPVSGKYTDRQKEVYNAVMHVKDEATKMLRPGFNIKEYHEEVGKIMEGKLIDLGLLDKKDVENQDPNSPAYKKYFMHGTSHHIGLDVHDVPSRWMKFEEGMVFTVEPGIYIPEEGFGIRIEDDVVVTKDEPFNLMRNIPIQADEIEDIMNGN